MGQKFLIITSLLLFSFLSEAQADNSTLLQILHTNDIHSYFESTHNWPERGGYARLKRLMDNLQTEAKAFGVETLRVDAGDFSEGTIFYMSDKARKSFFLHHEMGYDIAILGNHDYLMGTTELNNILDELNPSYHLLTANMKVHYQYEAINRHLKPYVIKEYAGKKVAFIGLTTNEFFYTWRLYNGRIDNPIQVGADFATWLKRIKGVDFVVAVTHIGFGKDRALARASSDIDLIIGGHSHTALYEPHYERSRGGKRIPIVQAGHHGEYLGRLILDLASDQLSILDYELVPVIGGEQDYYLEELVQLSREDLESLYGRDWLYQEVGYSELGELNEDRAIRSWAAFVTDSMMEKIGTDVAIHQQSMVSSNFPAGMINRWDILNGHPRFFDLEDSHGWEIYEMKIRGVFLQSLFKISMNFGIPLSISGISFEWKRLPGGLYVVERLRINGKRINPFRSYTVALPESIPRAANDISSFTSWIMRGASSAEELIVNSIEEKIINEDRVISKNYIDHMDRRRKREVGHEMPRVYFPGTPRD